MLQKLHVLTNSIPSPVMQLFEPFFADFGPLNLGKAYRYCRTTRELLQARPSLAALMHGHGGCAAA
jgi:hypothetical protein